MTQMARSSFDEISGKMKSGLPGRIALDIWAAIVRLNFLLSIAAWLLRAGSIIMEIVLLFASPVIMVSVSMPGFDAKHPSGLYTLALQALITAADVLVPGGLFSVIEKFIHRQIWWAVPLTFLWLVLTALTFLALATPMGVMSMNEGQLKQLLYWRTIDSLVYSALSLVAIVYTVRNHEPALKPEQEDAIETLSNTVVGLSKQVNGLAKPEIDYDRMVKEILPYLPQMPSSILPENIVTSEKIQVVEERILSQINDQNSEVVSLINSLLNRRVITLANDPEISGEISYQIPKNIGHELSDELQVAITGEITPPISEEITSQNSPVIVAPIVEKKAKEIPQEKPLPWDDVITKFPGVIEWQSAGLRSVTREQIIEVTNFSKNKVGRVKFSQVKGGNKRIESVLNWLTNEEPKKDDIKEGANTPQLSEEITPEITIEIAEEIEAVITDELEEVITPQKTKNTVPLLLSDLPYELRENNVVSEEEFERRKAHALKVEEDWRNGVNDAPLSDVVDEGIDFAKRYFKRHQTAVNTDPELTVVND